MFEECGDVSGAAAAGNGETVAAVTADLTGVVSCSIFGCSNASLRHRFLKGDWSSALTRSVAIATAANWRWAVTNQNATNKK